MAKDNIEIERRFLCRLAAAPPASAGTRLRQGYLTEGDPGIRIRDTEGSWRLTVKSGSGLSRREVEVDTPAAEGQALLDLAGRHVVEKVRYRLARWDVDVYEGVLEGLVVAECELERENEALPPAPEEITLGPEMTQEGTLVAQRLAFLDAAEARALVQRLAGSW